jgi:hypothetical protein
MNEFDNDRALAILWKQPDPYLRDFGSLWEGIANAIISENDEVTVRRLEHAVEMPELFYRGLANGHYLFGTVGAHPQLTDAIADFEKARTMDPSNGAYSLFMAMAKRDAGFRDAEVREDLLRAMRAPHFDTFYTMLARRVTQKGLASPELYYLATLTASFMPQPSIRQAERMIEERIHNGDQEVAEGAIDLGRKLLEPARRFGHEPMGIWWTGAEHAAGVGMIHTAWNALHPDEEPVPEDVKEAADWLKESVPEFKDPGVCHRAYLMQRYAHDREFALKNPDPL